jgi:hypothetical protein
VSTLPQEALERAIAPWLQVAARADAFFQRVWAEHGGQMRCAPGCIDCCRQDLTVLVVEALAILLGLARSPSPSPPKEGDAAADRCALLGADDLCTVYPYRPLICRTHGLPVLEESAVSCCPHNFTENVPRGAVLDGGLLSAQLVVADSLVRGEMAPTRVSIRDLVTRGAAALPEWPF